MEVRSAGFGNDRELFCVFVRIVTADKADINLDIAQRLCWIQLKEGEYDGRVPFSSSVSTVNVLRSSISIERFTEKLP